MTVEQMLTRLQANYESLETQFKQTDLSTIPPAKLVELMLRHVAAIQKGMQLLAKPSAPPPEKSRARQQADISFSPQAPAPPVPGAQNPPSAKPSSPPTPSTPSIPAPQSKTCPREGGDPKPVSAPASLNAAQDALDRLQKRNEAQSADLLRRLGITPPPKEPPYNPYRPKTTAPPRGPTP